MNIFSLQLICIVLILITNGANGECMHDHISRSMEMEQDLPIANQQYAERYPTSSNSLPIRILLDTSTLVDDRFACYKAGSSIVTDAAGTKYTCRAADVLSVQQLDLLLNKFLPAATERLSNALSVIRPSSPLKLRSGTTKCGYGPMVTFDSKYTSSGVDYDLVLFITARPIQQNGVIAFGTACQQDQYGRPIAGQLNFNPAYIDTDEGSHPEELGTCIHEISHVLGFSLSQFQSFNVDPSSGRSETAYVTKTSYSGANGAAHQVTRVNTPAVTKWVQDYFGCPTLEGAELEDGGTIATRGSHWEKRVFQNELMTGESTMNPVFSGLTLALFEDSGWYSVNYSVADRLVWGRGMGCDFVEKSCANWKTTGGYYCDAVASTAQCSFDHQARSVCNIKTFTSDDVSPPPSVFQYFSNPDKGGNDPLADYCTYNVPYSNGWCYNGGNSGSGDSKIAQVFGSSSRCAMSNVLQGDKASKTTQGVCYPTACVSSDQLKIKIGALWYDCASGATIQSRLDYSGSVVCPNTEILCTGEEGMTWPTITSVSPSKAKFGDTVTITGAFYTATMAVTIGTLCKDIRVINSNTITAVIVSSDAGDATDVIVEDTSTGKNVVAADAINLPTNTGAKAERWFEKFYYIPAAGGFILIVIAVVVAVILYKKKKAKRTYVTSPLGLKTRVSQPAPVTTHPVAGPVSPVTVRVPPYAQPYQPNVHPQPVFYPQPIHMYPANLPSPPYTPPNPRQHSYLSPPTTSPRSPHLSPASVRSSSTTDIHSFAEEDQAAYHTGVPQPLYSPPVLRRVASTGSPVVPRIPSPPISPNTRRGSPAVSRRNNTGGQ